MARGISTIEQQIKDAFSSNPVLGAIYSPSKVGYLNQFIFVIAVALHYHERFWDYFKADVEAIVESGPVGNVGYLTKKIKAFQNGDVLKINPDTFVVYYDTVNTSKQIITRCSIQENADNRNLLIKVAKGEADDASPLSEQELVSFKAYMEEVRTTGIPHTIISLNPDRLMLNAQIYYDGQIELAVMKQTVTDAINNYLSTLDFNSTVYKSHIISMLKSIDGVQDVKIVDLKGREEALPLSGTTPSIDRFYVAKSGYFITEDTADNTLEDTLAFIAV